jgi:hypothetical protein
MSALPLKAETLPQSRKLGYVPIAVAALAAYRKKFPQQIDRCRPAGPIESTILG